LFAGHHLDNQRLKEDMRLNMSSLVRFGRGPEKSPTLFAHCLNLVIVDTFRAIPGASCFFSLLQRLYVFLSGSSVHQKWQDIQRSMYQEDQPRELPRLSDIR